MNYYLSTKFNEIKDILKTQLGYAVAGGGMGLVLFFLVYGYAPLIPTNVSFLYLSKDYDLMSHQFGFDFYRDSSWMHPVGDTFSYPYPYLSSVINSDSVPLLAIPFKALDTLLPPYFQYFGIWHAMCFALLGCSSTLLLRRLGIGFRHAVAAVPLFVCNVPVLFRCFHHSSLAGQWVILFAFLLILDHEKMSMKKRCFFWCLLCAVSVLIHGYIFIMFGMLLTMNTVYSLVCRRQIKRTLIIFIFCVATFFFFYYEGGGTAVHSDVEIYGLGEYSLDLADMLNPEYSSFFSPFYSSSSEGALYIGTGLFLLIILAIVLVWKKRTDIECIFKNNRNAVIAVLISVIFFIIVSMGVRGKFAGVSLYDLRPVISDGLAVKLSMLRSTARFIWPVWYLILILAVVCVCQLIKNRQLSLIILMSCIIIQYMDVVPVTAKGGTDTVVDGFSSAISDNFDGVFSDEAEHLTLLGPSFIVAAADFASHNNMTFNASKVGRGPKNSLQIATECFNEGKYSTDSVYVLSVDHAEYLSPVLLPDDFKIFLCDDYILIFDNSLMIRTPGSGAIEISSERLYDIIFEMRKINGNPGYITNYEDI